MELSKKIIHGLQYSTGINVPQSYIFALPEKVLQFGTGVLLRGLPDYFIDKANKNAVFNGRIVVVKSTGNGGTDGFAEQDGLFTHCINGVADGKLVEQTIINASISRVLAAATSWPDILACASNPEMQVIISNTTEVGIVLVDDDISAGTPKSFPGKLLAFLYERYKKLGGTAGTGMAIVPTELIVDNATKLKAIVLEQASRNNLEPGFITWLNTQNEFCNSLVDRIVPGKMAADKQAEMEAKIGYTDGLMIMSEVYSLWAIETSNPSTIAKLSFAQTDAGVVIAPSIEKFRELKLRLLNGTHTFSCALAFLSGFEIVAQAMENENFGTFVKDLIINEIVPCIIRDGGISKEEAETFAGNVIDRFKNPNIQHKWINISVQYTGKMKMRNVPLLLKHYTSSETVPTHMAIGFAAYLQFLKPVENKDNAYFGFANGNSYKIDDESASWYFANWQGKSTEEAIKTSMSNVDIWGTDLMQLNGFYDAVLKYVKQFENGDFSKAY